MIELGSDTLSTPGARCEGDPSLQAIRDGKGGCNLGATTASAPVFAILGDSHARMWTSAFDELAHERRQYGIGLTYSSCVPLLDVVPPTRHAVSYTHLDVYKRQKHGNMAVAIEHWRA